MWIQVWIDCGSSVDPGPQNVDPLFLCAPEHRFHRTGKPESVTELPFYNIKKEGRKGITAHGSWDGGAWPQEGRGSSRNLRMHVSFRILRVVDVKRRFCAERS